MNILGLGRTTIFLTLGAALLSGCAAVPSQPVSAGDVAEASGWRATATDADKLRLRGWYSSWEAALADARKNGHGEAVAAEGPLLDPLAALPNAHLPAGDYRCRTIKVGSRMPGGLSYIAYGWFKCHVMPEQGIVSLTKLTGSQRPVGLVFPDTGKRQIFLGTLVLGDEVQPMDYGTDRMRDMAGMIERIGDRRWRLVLPAPAYESLVDVIELVPDAR